MQQRQRVHVFKHSRRRGRCLSRLLHRSNGTPRSIPNRGHQRTRCNGRDAGHKHDQHVLVGVQVNTQQRDDEPAGLERPCRYDRGKTVVLRHSCLRISNFFVRKRRFEAEVAARKWTVGRVQGAGPGLGDSICTGQGWRGQQRRRECTVVAVQGLQTDGVLKE